MIKFELNYSCMKRLLLLFCSVLLLTSCKEVGQKNTVASAEFEDYQKYYSSFGEKISPSGALSAMEMKEKYSSLKPGDTIQTKFSTKINSVCKMKGCWMTLRLPESNEGAMVKFKDYGFFVPKDIEDKEVIVRGLAFVEETSVEDQRHFAEDAGKSKAEIEKITKPKRTMSFLADGVLIKE